MEKLPHPTSDEGLPIVPAPFLIGCVETTPCPLRESGGCFEDVHHIYPRRLANTPMERKYIELPHNKERMCRTLHREFEETHETPVISREFMAGFLYASGVHLTKRVKTEVRSIIDGKKTS